jgi:hypothetical protein
MPYYNYICKDCSAAAVKHLGRELTEDDQRVLLFETRHGMHVTDKEIAEATQCPICDGHNTERTMLDVSTHAFVRGHNWEEFRRENSAALRRDMALHQLQSDDPYSSMREPGEKDDLAERLKRAAAQKPRPQHFLTPKS